MSTQPQTMTQFFVPQGTTLADAIKASLQSAQEDADLRNADNQRKFDMAVGDYNLNKRSGSPAAQFLKTPVAPPKYVLSQNAAGIWTADPSPTEVLTSAVPVTTIDNSTLKPPTPIQGLISVDWDSWHADRGVVSANKDDGYPWGPVKLPFPSPDRVMHTWFHFGTPFGSYYETTS